MDFENVLPGIMGQLLILLIGLLDDALLFGLSQLGCHIPGLQWLSPILCSGAFLYSIVHFWNHRKHKTLPVDSNPVDAPCKEATFHPLRDLKLRFKRS
jgi:hypothetical protein